MNHWYSPSWENLKPFSSVLLAALAEFLVICIISRINPEYWIVHSYNSFFIRIVAVWSYNFLHDYIWIIWPIWTEKCAFVNQFPSCYSFCVKITGINTWIFLLLGGRQAGDHSHSHKNFVSWKSFNCGSSHSTMIRTSSKNIGS